MHIRLYLNVIDNRGGLHGPFPFNSIHDMTLGTLRSMKSNGTRFSIRGLRDPKKRPRAKSNS